MKKRIEELKNGLVAIGNEQKQLLAQAQVIQDRMTELNNSAIANKGAIAEFEKMLSDKEAPKKLKEVKK